MFYWTGEDSFNRVKYALCTAPILAYPHTEKQFIIDTDASDVGIRGVPFQVQDGGEQ